MRSTDMRGCQLNGPNLEERLARMPKGGDALSLRRRQAKWYTPHPPWLPDIASGPPCRRRQRYKEALLSLSGGGSGERSRRHRGKNTA